MAEPAVTAYTADGRPLRLGPRLAAGGEGVVHALPDLPGRCAKVYHPTARTPERREKLEAMVGSPPAEPSGVAGHRSVAWPEALLLASPGGELAGFVMPLLPAGARTALCFLQPEERRRTHPAFNFRYLLAAGRNLAAALAAVHQVGCCAGDLNESNVMVTGKALVTLIDCDSFQVPLGPGRLARCRVGKPEYTAPELAGRPLAATDRTPASDAFALAVILFQLLMQGFHPFSGRWRGPGEPPDVARRMARGLYAYAGLPDLAPPPAAPPLEVLPRRVREAFERAFVRGVPAPELRPSAREWVEVLDAAPGDCRPCRVRGPQHLYPRGLRACPWCALAERGLDYFPEVVGAQVALPDVAGVRTGPTAGPLPGHGPTATGGAGRGAPATAPRPAAPGPEPRPRLTLEPAEVVFAAVAPGAAPRKAVLTVRNLGRADFRGRVEVVPAGEGVEVTPAALALTPFHGENEAQLTVRVDPSRLPWGARRACLVRVGGAVASVVVAAADADEAGAAAARYARWGVWGAGLLAAGLAGLAAGAAGPAWGPAASTVRWLAATILAAGGALHPLAAWACLAGFAACAWSSRAWRLRRAWRAWRTLWADGRWQPGAAAGALGLAAWPALTAMAARAYLGRPGPGALGWTLALAFVPAAALAARALARAAASRLRGAILRRGVGLLTAAAVAGGVAASGPVATAAAVALLRALPPAALRPLGHLPTPLGLLRPHGHGQRMG